MTYQIESDKEQFAKTAKSIGTTHRLIATRLKLMNAPMELIDNLVVANTKYQQAVQRFTEMSDSAANYQQTADEMDQALARCKVPFNSAIAWINAHRKDASNESRR
jgi:hypothetical protein